MVKLCTCPQNPQCIRTLQVRTYTQHCRRAMSHARTCSGEHNRVIIFCLCGGSTLAAPGSCGSCGASGLAHDGEAAAERGARCPEQRRAKAHASRRGLDQCSGLAWAPCQPRVQRRTWHCVNTHTHTHTQSHTRRRTHTQNLFLTDVVCRSSCATIVQRPQKKTHAH